MIQESGRQWLTTGQFARQTRLTAKALRIYDEIGLLRPAEVDPSTGRRRYEAGQVAAARLSPAGRSTWQSRTKSTATG